MVQQAGEDRQRNTASAPKHLLPAERYEAAPDLVCITSYFNPERYRSKRLNYERFAGSLRRSGLKLFTVECAFSEDGFDLATADRRVLARDVMWQKERLLNVAFGVLPPEAQKVAWLDADVLFTNPAWAAETSALLDQVPVVQPFASSVRLPRGATHDDGAGERATSFAAVLGRRPNALLTGRFDLHGHSGFAWACRREVLEGLGLYDACIAGSGDHMMAHAFAGDWDGPCIDRIIGAAPGHRRSFTRWAAQVYERVRARVRVVDGTLLHLWHGEFGNRRYVERNRQLASFEFDPERDVRVSTSGAWEWSSAKPQLHAWARSYFAARREDHSHENHQEAQ